MQCANLVYYTTLPYLNPKAADSSKKLLYRKCELFERLLLTLLIALKLNNKRQLYIWFSHLTINCCINIDIMLHKIYKYPKIDFFDRKHIQKSNYYIDRVFHGVYLASLTDIIKTYLSHQNCSDTLINKFFSVIIAVLNHLTESVNANKDDQLAQLICEQSTFSANISQNFIDRTAYKRKCSKIFSDMPKKNPFPQQESNSNKQPLHANQIHIDSQLWPSLIGFLQSLTGWIFPPQSR